MKVHDLKKSFLFAAVGQTGYQNSKKKKKIENPLESIGASISKISLLKPEMFKVKEWFQVKVPTPCGVQSFPIGVYGYDTLIWHCCGFLPQLLELKEPRLH